MAWFGYFDVLGNLVDASQKGLAFETHIRRSTLDRAQVFLGFIDNVFLGQYFGLERK